MDWPQVNATVHPLMYCRHRSLLCGFLKTCLFSGVYTGKIILFWLLKEKLQCCPLSSVSSLQLLIHNSIYTWLQDQWMLVTAKISVPVPTLMASWWAELPWNPTLSPSVKPDREDESWQWKLDWWKVKADLESWII